MKWLWLTVGTKTLAAIVLGSIHWSDKWCDVGRTKTKRQRLAELIEQQNLYISCLYIETHFISMDTYRGDGQMYSKQMEIKRKLE